MRKKKFVPPKSVYGTPWIEVEFGQREEGWKVHITASDSYSTMLNDSKTGGGYGGYLGPERPCQVYEIPWDCLEDKMKESLTRQLRSPNLSGVFDTPCSFSSNNWQPKFKAKVHIEK